MDVSIIIVNYNTNDLLKDCINSIIINTKGIQYEIIVVDNNSQISPPDSIIHIFPEILLIKNNDNLGFGKANNKGIEAAKGRNIFFLNPDTVLINDAITILSKELDKNQKIGAVGGNLYTKELEPNISYHMRFPFIFEEIDQITKRFFSNILYGKNAMFNHSQNPQKVAYITGADLMIRKSLLDEVGYFDPVFFMYYEETELLFRIKKKGYDIVNIPAAKIIHYEGQSFTCSYNREKRALTSRIYFLQKCKSKLYEKIASYILYNLTSLIKILIPKNNDLYSRLDQRICILKELSSK